VTLLRSRARRRRFPTAAVLAILAACILIAAMAASPGAVPFLGLS
jgi:hypothetical protein